MKTYEGSRSTAPPFLTSAPDGGECLASRPGERVRGTLWIRRWVNPRAGLDTKEKRKSCLCRDSSSGRPARSPSLYRLSYPKSFLNVETGGVYRVSQEEKSLFWEVMVSVILSKKCICTCVIFGTVFVIELFHCTVPKLLIRKKYYVLFLMPAFIVHVTKLVHSPTSASMHFATRVRTAYRHIRHL
jgi:hypothetical protein